MTTNLNKNALSIGLYIVIILAVVFFGLRPTMQSLKNNRDKLATKRTELDETYKKIEALQKNSKHPEEFNKISETVNNYWPDNLDVSQFIVQTENLAKNNSLIIENFSVEQTKVAPKKAATTTDEKKDDTASTTTKKAVQNSNQFTFTSKAPYGTILNVIKNMENIARFNTISSISLAGDNEGQIDLRLTGSIYYGK